MLWRCFRSSRVQQVLTRHILAPDRGQLARIRAHNTYITTRSSSATAAAEKHVVERSDSHEGAQGLKKATIGQDGPQILTHAHLRRLSETTSSPVRIAGLVRSIRKHKNVYFVHVSDGTTLDSIQAVIQSSDVVDIHNGSYVELEGQWQESQGRGQSHELSVSKCVKVGASDPDVNPMQKKDMSVDHLRAYPHLRIRTPLYSMLNRLRGQVIGSFHAFYAGVRADVDEAVFVQPPLITSSDCEGAGETFTITPKDKPEAQSGTSQDVSKPSAGEAQPLQEHYFRNPKYLTVSSQLHLEAFAAELGKVWTLSPVFRAEESDTSRHLSEFWMLEAEFRNMDTLAALMQHVQDLIQHVMGSLRDHQIAEELQKYGRTTSPSSVPQSAHHQTADLEARWDALLAPNWSVVTYSEAIAALTTAMASTRLKFRYKPTWDTGLQLEHERWLVENLGRNKPIFVTDYPKHIKPFYMKASHDTSDPERDTVACFDLLLPYGTCEVVGGSLREHNLELLVANMRAKGLLKQSVDGLEVYPHLLPGESLGTLQWYADLRRFGSSPHAGFGLGLDRLLMYLAGINHVREIVPFPRTFGTAHC